MTDKKINKYFELAKNAASFSDFHKQKIGSVIIYKNKVLSVGWNSQKESNLQKKYNQYAKRFDVDLYPNRIHAEINALQKLRKKKDIDFSKCHIFIYRSSNNILRLARPCKACEKALRDIGIVNIHYTGNNSLIDEKYIGDLL